MEGNVKKQQFQSDRETAQGELERRLGYEFRSPERLAEALRHRSVASFPTKPSNERLEFLGDAALSLAVAEMLFRHWPEAREGDLTRARAALVRGETLAKIAVSLGIDKALQAAPGVEPREALVADAFEAVLGALALEVGYRRFARIVHRLFRPFLDQLARDELATLEPKSALQELAQRRGWALPVYRQVEVRGPEHQRVYVFEVELENRVRGRGEGPSKKLAQREAARVALELLAQGEKG